MDSAFWNEAGCEQKIYGSDSEKRFNIMDGNSRRKDDDNSGHMEISTAAGHKTYPFLESENQPVLLSRTHPFSRFFRNTELIVISDDLDDISSYLDLDGKKPAVIVSTKDEDIDSYEDKFTDIFRFNPIRKIVVMISESQPCQKIISAMKSANEKCEKYIPLSIQIINQRRAAL